MVVHTITAHELAKKLLAGPDTPVLLQVSKNDDYILWGGEGDCTIQQSTDCTILSASTKKDENEEANPLLQRLADNLDISGEYGWEEEPDDRDVIVTADTLEINTTFEHDDDRGGRQRFSTTFTIKGDKLIDDNENECSLADEAALQAFVNDIVSYHEG